MSAARSLFRHVGEGVLAIDTEFVRPQLDASHLIFEGGRGAFVDTGTHHSVPNLLAALSAADLAADDVDYILLTHVHLDHAGGVGRLAESLPRARVVVHPRGAAHVRDPSKLIAATKAVYGAEVYARYYGEMRAVAAERIVTVEEGERLPLGRRTLEFIHTPGHALHHLCIVDRDAGEIFAGDTFGVSYRELDTAAGEFVFAATTPSQFDPVQLHASVDRILQLRPKAAYLTHYSRVEDIPRLGADMHADIDAYVAIAARCAALPERSERIAAELFDHLSARLDAHGHPGDASLRHALLDGDVRLNTAGLDAWLSRAAR